MSDFNATEDGEMSKVREIFERALNAIVAATQLSKDLASLRGEFDALRSEIDAVRAHNVQLDNELVSTREQRDQYARDKAAAIAELNSVKEEFANGQFNYDTLQAAHDSLKGKHEALKHDHDNAQLELMQAQDELKSLKAQLEKVKAVFGIQPRDVETGKWQSPSIVEQPAPEPEPAKTGTYDPWR